MSSRSEDRRGGLSGTGDALIFLAFTASGVGYIVWSKAAGLPATAVTAVPVAIMLIYAAALIFIRAMRLADDQGGDNLYYMGFLFTLSSLAVSLWQFSADGAAEQIVQNFGVAIASTVAGIALRIVLNQMRRDPVSVERGGRIELADAARRVRRELDATVVEFNEFRRSTQQVAEESWSGVREEVAAIARAITDEIAAARAAETPLETTAARSAEALGTVERETQRAAEALAALATSLDGVVERLAGFGAPDRMVTLAVEPMLAPLAAASERFGDDLRQHAAAMDRLTAAMERSDAVRRADRAAVDGLAERLTAIAAVLTGDDDRASSSPDRDDAPSADEAGEPGRPANSLLASVSREDSR